uniref:Uncharacterized protein n=1 Tax=Moniliophthora roreri TaxID=221103 RepID=A0A0W0GCE3_MONRR
MTCKVKSKSTATPIASFSKSKDVSLPQLSSINATTLSILHLHCMMLFDTCRNIWRHLEGQSSLFTSASALANYAFPAMKIPLYCGKFWFPHTFMRLLLLALQLLKCLESCFSISIPNNLYSAFPSKSQFHFWKHTLGLKPLNPLENFPSNEEILAEYDPDQNVPDINNDIEISDHEDSDSSNEDGSGDEDIVEVKPSKHPVRSIKPPAHATPIVEVLVHSSGSSKTKQKSRPAAASSSQVNIKMEPSSSKCKACDTSLPQPPARKRAHNVTKAADKSSDPKGKKRAVDPPPDEGEKNGAEDMDIDELDPSQPSAAKSIQDLNLEDIVGGIFLLRVEEESVKSALQQCRELLRASCADPCVILKYLFWHDPNFTPSEKQLNILCTSLGWIARDMGVPDSYEFEVICPVDPFSASLSDVQVILKGTDFDVTGLKSGSYMIVDNKVVMVNGSKAPHFEGLTVDNEAGPSNSTADTGPSSATPRAASPTNTIDLTNQASATVAENANPLLVDVPQPVSLLTPLSASDSITFFGLPHLLTAPESTDEDEDEVLYTLPT